MGNLFYLLSDSIAAVPVWLKILIIAAVSVVVFTVLLRKHKRKKEKFIAEEKNRKMEALNKAISNEKKGG